MGIHESDNVVTFPQQARARRSQQVTSWNADEEAALEGLPHRVQVLYLRGLRRHMDYATGIVGRVRRISIDQFRELLEYRPPARSHERPETFSRQQVTRMLDRLEEAGLVQRLHRGKGVRVAMEFWLPLADADGVPEEVIGDDVSAGRASQEKPATTGAGAGESEPGGEEFPQDERAMSEHGRASHANRSTTGVDGGESEPRASTAERATSGTSGVEANASTSKDAREGETSDAGAQPRTPKQRPEAAIQNRSGSQWGTAEDLELAEWMADLVDALPGGTENRSMAAWADQIRLMRERDGRELRHIRALFAWANADEFWQANIRSPRKLRAQWKPLAIKRNQERERAKAQEARHAQRTTGRPGAGQRRQSAAEARAQARGQQPGGGGDVIDGEYTPGR